MAARKRAWRQCSARGRRDPSRLPAEPTYRRPPPVDPAATLEDIDTRVASLRRAGKTALADRLADALALVSATRAGADDAMLGRLARPQTGGEVSAPTRARGGGALRGQMDAPATDADDAPPVYLSSATGAPGGPDLAESMERLTAWADGALDAHRWELAKPLYPLLIHAAVRLLERGDAAAALALIERGRGRHVELRGAALPRRAAELDAIEAAARSAVAAGPAGSARAQKRWATSEPGQALARRVASVTMSESSADLFFGFLEGTRSTQLLSLVNDRLEVHARPGPPRLDYDDDADPDAPCGARAGAREATAIMLTNDQPIDDKIGRLAGGWEDLLDLRQRKEDERWRLDEAERRKRARTDRDAAAAPPTPRPPPPVPTYVGDRAALVKPSEPIAALVAGAAPSWHAEVLSELSGRVLVDRDRPPSCVLATFVNTSGGLCCVDMARDATLAATGWEDASVRLFDLREDPPELTEAARSIGLGGRRTGSRPAASGPRGADDDPNVCVLRGHRGPVFGVSLSQDGCLALSGGADGSVRLWSTELRCHVAVYRRPALPIWDVAFHPYGYLFAAGSADRAARVWATDRSHSPVRVLAGHDGDVDVVGWHPAAGLVVTGSSDRTVRLWDVNDGRCARVLAGSRAPITSLACSPCGHAVAAGCDDGAIRVWDVRMPSLLATWLEAHAGPVWSLAWSEGAGARLASGGGDAAVRVWRSPLLGPEAAAAAADAAAAPAAAPPAARRPDLAHEWRTRSTDVYHLGFTWRNLLMGAGALTLR